jgi:hypothetical protein
MPRPERPFPAASASTAKTSVLTPRRPNPADYDSRKQHFKQLQKEWLKQQMAEKQERKAREKQEELFYAQQTMELNRMR